MPDTRPERPLFTEGQYIGAADLTAIVGYERDDKRRLMLSGNAWGIAVGLALIERITAAGAVELYIEPGVAWDGYGRPIVVLSPVQVTPDLLAGLPSGNQKVWLRYDETQTSGVAPGFQTCNATDPFTRVQENYVIVAGPMTAVTDRTDGVTIGGAAVADPRNMLIAVDQNAPVVLDGSAPQQTLPADSAHWLVPIGIASWQAGSPGSFQARTSTQLLVNRTVRRYLGVIGETVLASDGVLRLRDRRTLQQIGKTNDDLDTAATIQTTDLQADPTSGFITAHELFWVEGNIRVIGDARLFGGKLDLRGTDGQSTNGVSFYATRAVSADNPMPGGQDFRIVIGNDIKGADRLAVGPLDPSKTDGSIIERMILRTDGRVGIGTNTPVTTLHLVGTGNGQPTNDPGSHAAYFENPATSNASGLAIKLNQPLPPATPPPAGNNYITFFNNTGTAGCIKMTNTGAAYNATGADFAEYLPRADGVPPIGAGRIVGIAAGRISLTTSGAEGLLVTTDRAGFIGNAPRDEVASEFEVVALVGQVVLAVEGPVTAGDFILPSGCGDGIGRAVSPAMLAADNLSEIVGRAWESSTGSGVKQVNVFVGGGATEALARTIAAQAEAICELRAEVARLTKVLGR
jgi:hypothetical protein